MLFLLACQPPPSTTPEVTPSDDFTARPEVDEQVLAIMEQDKVPGVAACTLKDGVIDWCQGYGWANIEEERAVDQDTPFLLASVSKLITSEAARETLDPQGVVDVGFTIGHPIDEPDITHQMLATHTSGIADNWGVMGSYYSQGDSPVPLGDFLYDYLDPEGADYDDWNNFGDAPGQRWDYSNIGNALLAYAVEIETGTDFSDWCDANVFEPWAMQNTSWRLANLDESTLAMPYDGLFSTDPTGHYSFPDYPNGALRSSAYDMALFLENTATLQHEELVPDLAEGQGWVWYRWTMEGHTVWGHNGGEAGVSTEVGLLDDGRGFVVLMNGEGSQTTLGDIERAILEI